MVGNAVDPRPQGTAGIVPLKAPPHLKMNVLAQVAAFFRVAFVGAYQPFERRAELLHCLAIQLVLTRSFRRYGLRTSHIR